MNKCERIEQQNERMRLWFKNRTGLKTNMLSSHMKKIDKMLGEQNPSANAGYQEQGGSGEVGFQDGVMVVDE